MTGGHPLSWTFLFRYFAERSKSLNPIPVPLRKLSYHFRISTRDILFLPGIRREIKELPGILLILSVETPLLPTHRNKMPPYRISRFVGQPKETCMRTSFLFAP